jgi:hypothetical protein
MTTSSFSAQHMPQNRNANLSKRKGKKSNAAHLSKSNRLNLPVNSQCRTKYPVGIETDTKNRRKDKAGEGQMYKQLDLNQSLIKNPSERRTVKGSRTKGLARQTRGYPFERRQRCSGSRTVQRLG